MKKKIIHSIIIAIAFLWLSLSFIRVYNPFAPIGKLFSYPEGIFFMTNPEENLAVENTDFDVQIFFDEYGVPTIEGESANDVAFGLGFMHARDRYFQMELITRTVQGSLSEILGELTLQKDIFWKPLEVEKLALKEWEKIRKENQDVYNYLMAYNDGIRMYLSTEKKSARFPEYKMLDEQPRRWEDHYPLLLSYYMSYMLAYSDGEMDWALNQGKLPQILYKQLFSVQEGYPYMFTENYDAEVNKTLSIDSSSLASVHSIARKEIEKNQSIGSNAWVVSNSHTAGEGAFLCNDTHLTVAMPNPWYQVHLVCKDFHVQGFTIPCNPFVLSGNNEDIAWGITNTHWDEVDIFKLQADGQYYTVDGQRKSFETKTNEIQLKGGDPFVFETKHSDFGIVHERKGQFFAEKWHALDFNSSVLTFMQLNVAQNWDDFRTALKKFTFPPQNFVFSDKNGNIGMISAGKLPLKSATYNGEFLDGSKAMITEYVAFDNLPQQYYGDSLFASSTNQLQAKANYYLNYNWTAPYRALRINELLSHNNALTMEDMKQAQTDKTDCSFHATMELYKAVKLNQEQSNYLKSLKKWDGKILASSKEAVKYYYLYQAIAQNFDALLEKRYRFFGRPSYEKILEIIDPRKAYHETFIPSKEFLLAALDTARIWNQRYANDEINYGQVQPFYMNHILRIPGLGRIIPEKGGNSNSLDVNGYGEHGASMRSLIRLTNNEAEIYTVLAGGQSGRITSPAYDNQVNNWKNGVYHQVDFFLKNKPKQPHIIFKK